MRSATRATRRLRRSSFLEFSAEAESLKDSAAAGPKRQRRAKLLFKEPSVDLLWTIAVILIILWLLGMVSSYTLGGFVHILLVLAIIVILIRVIQGRRPV